MRTVHVLNTSMYVRPYPCHTWDHGSSVVQNDGLNVRRKVVWLRGCPSPRPYLRVLQLQPQVHRHLRSLRPQLLHLGLRAEGA